jgi:hypothetical protein
MGKQPMAEATMVVKTLDEAVQANRGSERFCKAFGISEGTLARWRDIGVPRTHALGLYLGLRARGCDIRSQLFGVKNWEDIPGVAL